MGSTRTGGDIVRRTSKTDNYSTPAEAVAALRERESFAATIFEPAAGEGSIARSLPGHEVTTADIRELPGVDYPGVDLFSERAAFITCFTKFDIITNPPYSIALPFAKRCLELAERKVALLLRIQFLEGIRRREWLESSPLKAIYVFSNRIVMWPEGTEERIKTNNGTQCFAWFVWDKEYTGEPVVRWVVANG